MRGSGVRFRVETPTAGLFDFLMFWAWIFVSLLLSDTPYSPIHNYPVQIVFVSSRLIAFLEHFIINSHYSLHYEHFYADAVVNG